MKEGQYSLNGNPRQGLFGATLGFFIGFAAVSLFGPTATKFNEVMHLTPVMVGFLVAMPSLSGSLLRIPFAAWVDTTGGRKPFLVLLGLAVAGMAVLTGLIFWLYPNGLHAGLYPLLLLLGLLCGCGIATFSVGISQVSYWFPRRQQGRALGLYAGVGNLAPGIFSFLLPLALGAWGLASSYLAWFLFLLAGSALYFFLGRNSWFFQLRAAGFTVEQAQAQASRAGQEVFPAGSLKASLSLSARAWRTWLLVAIYFSTFGGFMALTSWFPTYWKSLFALSAVTAGGLTAAYSILASLSRAFGGGLADRMGGENMALSALSISLLGSVVMMFARQPAMAIAGVLVLAVGMGLGNAAVFKLVPQYVPQAVGGASGWVGGLGAFGGFVFPPILGAIARSLGLAGYAWGFGLFTAVFLLALGLALALKRAVAPVPQVSPG